MEDKERQQKEKLAKESDSLLKPLFWRKTSSTKSQQLSRYIL